MLIIMSHNPHQLSKIWENSSRDVYQVTSFAELSKHYLHQSHLITGILIDLSFAMQNQWDLLKSVATLSSRPPVFIAVINHQTIPEHIQQQALLSGADYILSPPLSNVLLEGYLEAFSRRQKTCLNRQETHNSMDWRERHLHPQQQSKSPSPTLPSGELSLPPSSPATHSKTFRLTQREKQVLSHLVEGKSNAAIAEALSISRTTVKNHLAQVFRKLSVSNRTAAAFMAQQHGLTDSSIK